MATFEPISYAYVPTPPRSKSTTARRKIPLKSISTLDKNERIKPSNVVLEKPQSFAVAAAVEDIRDKQSRFQTETGIIYSDNNKENNDYFPTVEEILYTALHKEGFATENSEPDKTAQEIDEGSSRERNSSIDHRMSMPDDGLGTSESNPIFLEEDKSDTTEAETDYSSHRSKSAELDAGLFNSTGAAFDSRSSVHPSHLEAYHGIEHYIPTKTAEGLQLAEEEEASASDAMHHHSPSSRPSSEPLHNHSKTDDLCTRHARFEASILHFGRPQSQPPPCSRASPQYKPSQDDRLLTSGGASIEGELLRYTPGTGTDTVDKENEQQRHIVEEENKTNDNDENNVDEEQDSDIDDRHREVNNVAAAQTARRGGDTHLSSKEDESALSAKRQRLLPSHDPFSQLGQERTGSPSDSCSDGEISNPAAKSDEEQRRPRPRKRKQPSSSYEGKTQKKRRHHPQQRSTQQPKPHNRSQQHYAKSALPSPAPSTPQALDTELPSNLCTVGGLSGDTRLMLTEITFRPHSLHECSFTAVIRTDYGGLEFSFSQVAKLIENIGYFGKIADFTIKPLAQNSFLLVGFSGGMGTGSKASCMHRDVTGIQLQHSKAVDARAIALYKGELLRTEHDDVLSDSDPDLSSSDDDKSSTEDEQGRSSIRKHSAWLPLDEQRLLAYRKEGKSWSWIFRKFPGRTPGAVRTRCHMVQARLPEWHRNKNDEEGADVADEAKPKRRQGRPPKKK